jgi:hypothetical protein
MIDDIKQRNNLIVEMSTALDDWLNTYASEFCEESRVAEATDRIYKNNGTVAYIAKLQEKVAMLDLKD